MTFSSLQQDTMKAYFGPGMGKETSDMLMNWGPILGIGCFPFAVCISAKPGGLRKALWCGMLLTFFGSFIRIIPIVVREMSGDLESTQISWSYACFHIGQIFVSAAGPFNMGAVTLLSVVWFAETERTTATAMAQISNNMGATVAYLNPLWLVTAPASVPNMFYFSLALATFPILCALVFLPAHPRHYPSVAAEVAITGCGSQARPGTTQFRQVLSNHSFVILILAVGFFEGVTIGWSSLFQTMLGPLKISESSVGWMGFANGLASNIAGIIAGSMIDLWFRHRLKAGILVGLFGNLSFLFAFMLSLPCFGVRAPNSILPHSDWSLALALTLAGTFQGILEPLCYELAAELMYPAKESTSAGILVFILNVVAGLVIGSNTFLSATAMNYLINVIVFLVFLSILFGVTEEYKRPQNKRGDGVCASLQPTSA